MEGLISTEQLADFLSVPAKTIRAWRSKGSGPRYLRIGKHVRYRWSDVNRWLEKQVEER